MGLRRKEIPAPYVPGKRHSLACTFLIRADSDEVLAEDEFAMYREQTPLGGGRKDDEVCLAEIVEYFVKQYSFHVLLLNSTRCWFLAAWQKLIAFMLTPLQLTVREKDLLAYCNSAVPRAWQASILETVFHELNPVYPPTRDLDVNACYWIFINIIIKYRCFISPPPFPKYLISWVGYFALLAPDYSSLALN
jgi:hypothetical protein